jgi:hypothetical protein
MHNRVSLPFPSSSLHVTALLYFLHLRPSFFLSRHNVFAVAHSHLVHPISSPDLIPQLPLLPDVTFWVGSAVARTLCWPSSP